MQMIILCGGLGTRLREVIGERQKTMVDIKGKPFLETIIEYYKTFGINDFVFACGYKKEEIENYFKNGKDFGITCEYAVEEEPLGTGGAIKNSINYIKGDKNTYFYVVNGDTLFKADINLLKKNAKAFNTDLSIIIKKVDDTSRYGSIIFKSYDDEKGGLIKDFSEKIENKDSFINGGIYLVKKSLIEEMEKGKFSFEKDLMPKWINEGKTIGCIKSNDAFIDIGTKESLEKFKGE